MSAPRVRLEWGGDGVVVVAMEDRATRNSLTAELGDEMEAAFAAIAARPEARVVVLHGYDSYFSCGGTRDQLIAIAERRMKYTDIAFFDLCRRCDLPVIAALQGHAIGGGLALGLHADFQVLGEECLYTANFMAYGFTPGMGSTYTLPRRFGEHLGWEMLFTGANFRGAELRARGVPVPVRPRAEVVPHALALARAMAPRPVVSLRELKRRWRETTEAALREAVRREVEMQDVTFPQPEVQERVRTLYQE
jgi:polyketide biosynthesis enoyl-CoA hydratase PksI